MAAEKSLTALLESIQDDMKNDRRMRTVARRLAHNELFDYTLYRRLAAIEDAETRALLERLGRFEETHIEFWKTLAGMDELRLTPVQRWKLGFLLLIRRLVGRRITYLILEAIEHYGIGNYVKLWDEFKDTPLARGIREILLDELEHEDEIVDTAARRQLTGEDVRNMVLGLNDGLVEILGSVGGFFAAFHRPLTVALAASIVGFAGALSMGAGTYISIKSEREVREIEAAKERVLADLKNRAGTPAHRVHPIRSALVVALFYIFGALVPVLPVWLGMHHIWVSVGCGAGAVILVSAFLATISGVPMTRKILENLLIAMGAVALTYLIGWAARRGLGITL